MSIDSYRTIIMKPIDNVAVALEDIPSGAKIVLNVTKERTTRITLHSKIAFGHKFAVTNIKKGSDILKYGEVIGRATRDIQQGEHVHVHNLEGTRGRGDIVGTNERS
ncbi:UxaA family hydrolase [Metabacillus sp. Hm71]|uniref:UxaA family hydrolase n=1 Tax=Metabacillus sp. Hm71 TaxID=3450743 RepID=UPI003F428360